MSKPASVVNIVDFTGLLSERGKLHAPPGAASVLTNMRVSKPGVLAVRKGHSDTDLANSTAALAIFRMDRPEGTGVVYQSGSSLYFSDDI